MTMTPEQIASAWALVNAATEGPWHVAGVRVKLDRQDTHAICKYDEDAKRDLNIANVWYDPKTGLGYADARFIIASRSLIPQLLTALEAAELREAALLANNEAERKTLVLHNAAHAAALEAERAKVARLVEGLGKAEQQLFKTHDDALKQALGQRLATGDGRSFSCFQINTCQEEAARIRALLASIKETTDE